MPDSLFDTPEEVLSARFTIAHHGMRESVPGSEEYQRWEQRLARWEAEYRESKMIEEMGYMPFVEARISQIPPEHRRAAIEAFGGIALSLDSAAYSKPQGGDLSDRDATRDDDCVTIPYEDDTGSNNDGISQDSIEVVGWTPYSVGGPGAWVLTYTETGPWSAQIGEIAVICDFEPSTPWPECPVAKKEERL